MDFIADITGARRALRQYLTYADGKLPEPTFSRLEELADSPSPVDAIVRSAELLYARRDELDNAGRTLVAQLASFAATNAWHGMATNNRGGWMAQAMMRDAGVTPEPGQPAFQPEDQDPKPAPEFVKAADPAPTA